MPKDEQLTVDCPNPTGELIHRRRKDLGLSLQAVGDAVGVGKSTVRKWEIGSVRAMKKDRIVKLAEVLQVSVGELLDSEILPEDEKITAPPELVKGSVQIPVVGRIPTGSSRFLDSKLIESYENGPKYVICNNNRYVFLRVRDNSMSPIILDKDMVLIYCQKTVDNGTYAVVFIDDEDGVIRKYRSGKGWIELSTADPYVPIRRFEGENVNRVRIFGKVIECRRKF